MDQKKTLQLITSLLFVIVLGLVIYFNTFVHRTADKDNGQEVTQFNDLVLSLIQKGFLESSNSMIADSTRKPISCKQYSDLVHTLQRKRQFENSLFIRILQDVGCNHHETERNGSNQTDQVSLIDP